jgi:CheY-like chemotaxis protein
MRLLHILLAEDNRGDVMLVREALREHHIEHELHVVQDGQQALDYVVRMGKAGEAPCPDILLLDLNLPKADGRTVLTEFRKHPECAKTPVVVVTSSDAPKDRAHLGQAAPKGEKCTVRPGGAERRSSAQSRKRSFSGQAG